MSGQVVKRKRKKIEDCMRCPLCNMHFCEATTICECLHTFCKKCIYSKIVDEELDCCPQCNTHLGVAPLEKLRPDRMWDNIVGNIFPSDREKVNVPEDNNAQDTTSKPLPSERKMVKEPADCNAQDMTAELLPYERRKIRAPADFDVQDITAELLPSESRKSKTPADDNVQDVEADPLLSGRKKVKEPAVPSTKEIYLSSLLRNSPPGSGGSEMSGQRRYPARRRFPLQESLSIQEPEKNEDVFHERLKSPQTLKTVSLFTKQNSAKGTLKQHMLNKGVVDNSQSEDVKPEIWKQLNRLVEAASKTSPDKINLQLQLPISEPMLPDALNNEAREVKPVIEYGNKSKVGGSVNQSNPAPSGLVSFRKPQRGRKRKPAVPDGLNIPAQSVVDANDKCDRILRPIWFSLFASEHQEGFPPLPQLPSCYLRVKDGSFPASFLKKYLVKKLNLSSEDEVEVTLHGKPILPTLELHNLVDLWLQTTASASQRIQATVGSSAKEYVLPLTYSRKMLLR
ncbi:hypothetical protein ACFXTH_022290 [Malus domestica]